MSAEDDTAIITPSSRALFRILAAGLLVAAAIVALGLHHRSQAQGQLTQWTEDQAIPSVALAKLEPGGTASLILPGTVQPYNKAAIYARVSGYLKNWKTDIGAKVRAGQELAVIDTPDLDQQLGQAEGDLTSAEANDELAQLTADRWRALVASRSVSQQAADEKTGDAKAKRALRNAAAANVRRLQAFEGFKTIVAPFDGTITARNTDVGALINAGGGQVQPLFEVSDLHLVRIYVQVPQAMAAELHPGLKASFDMPQYPGRSFDATLTTSSNAIGAGSGSMLVELQADNSAGLFAAGIYCQVHFELPDPPQLVRIPATALIPGAHGVEVALLGADDKVVLRQVQLGRDLGDSVEVVAGLSPADRVIDSPPETVVEGEAVRLAPPAVAAK